MTEKPSLKPMRPFFSSGPCAKRPDWKIQCLESSLVGRSHRSKPAKDRLQDVVARSRALLGIPDDYLCGIVPGSDTGAVEIALWSLLGARGVDMLAWESFGAGWITDVVKQLKLEDARLLEADYGELPDLEDVDFGRDVVFTWNGTTSGVKVPDGNWIPANRQGLSICDATSAAFAMELPWDKLDVATWSWQKVMGGEAAHGMLVLGPRAVERLESYQPAWPLPKLFRLTKGGKLNRGIFEGSTINTVSMLCVEDALDGLRWAESIGGLPELISRSQRNLAAIEAWARDRDWIDFLPVRPETRSSTSICLKFDGPWSDLSADKQAARSKQLVALLEAENVAYDFGAYRDAPPGIRIWGGATVETEDIQQLLPWIDWARSQVERGERP